MTNYSQTYSTYPDCGKSLLIAAKYLVNNLHICGFCVNTHILTANLRALIYSFLGKSQTDVSLFSSRLSTLPSYICSRCGAPPLRVAAVMHRIIPSMALWVGIHGSRLVAPCYFRLHLFTVIHKI